MKHDTDTSENQTAEQQLLERISREYHSLKRDRPGNVLATKEALEACHEATRFAVFLEAIGHDDHQRQRRTGVCEGVQGIAEGPHLDSAISGIQKGPLEFGGTPDVIAGEKGILGELETPRLSSAGRWPTASAPPSTKSFCITAQSQAARTALSL